MGQGYSITTPSSGSDSIDVPELSDLIHEKSLGNARFMKAVRARHKDGLVVAKVVMKPYPSLKLDEYVKVILNERKLLADIPNAVAYHRVIETSSNGYLVRQYFYSSLYDRMSTRPFLEDIEKRWLAFQLLCAVRDCHAQNIYHGDIKSENILVTSWNWLYLSDFSSSFKPTYLPEDNPANFSFYFDTSGRRTCYLAPERFLFAGEQVGPDANVNWSMDIFSVGCVIAELFIENPVFSLAQLFRYRKGESDPENGFLRKIADKEVRSLVAHMIQLEPESRYSAEEYLNFWRQKAFPEYFYSFLHQYISLITDPSSGRSPITAGGANLGESDDRIDRIYSDFDKIAYFLDYNRETRTPPTESKTSLESADIFPLHVDLPSNSHAASRLVSKDGDDDGTLIFLGVVLSSLRSSARATAKVRACELMLAFAERVTDEIKLDRILPYLMVLLNDKADIVRVAALRTATQILALVTVVSPTNAYIFPEYILPRLLPYVNSAGGKASQLIRTTYASCLATLATTAARFLDIMQALRADGTFPTNDPEAEDGTISQSTYQMLFDVAREDLMHQFETHTKALLTDTDSAVRRAFLTSVSSLCVFFGSVKANDIILSHLNTYLNDRDWMLRCAFFKTIVGVATYVGGTSLEEYILPLMIQALTDPEEFVVERVLRSFSTMAKLGLFQRSQTWELVEIACRFTMHPNIWIREAAVEFVASTTTYLSIADVHAIIIPFLTPYVNTIPTDLSELRILESLKKPLSRLLLDMAVIWATKADKGSFWKAAKNPQKFSSFATNPQPRLPMRGLSPRALDRGPKNEEDERWMNRLRNAGMKPEDESKLVALREYIWRTAQRKARETSDAEPSRFNHIVSLRDLKITPQTVFFDPSQPLALDEQANNRAADEAEQPHTIADALLDASTKQVDDDAIIAISNRTKQLALDRSLAREPNGENRNLLPTPQLNLLDGRADAAVGSDDNNAPQKPGEGTSQNNVNNDDEDSGPSSTVSSNGGTPGRHKTIQHKNSALLLLARKESVGKASAEISTTSTNVFGEVDGANTLEASARRKLKADGDAKVSPKDVPLMPSNIKYKDAHSYVGSDPSVLRLLDTLYVENYPGDILDFGPLVTPVGRRQPIRSASGQPQFPWRPEGVIVGMLSEHTASVNRVVVAPDHLFFITGSDDGTVKIWDSSRLERNVSYRSRQTYKHSAGARVTSLSFVENTHCFISTGTDGSIHVVKVDHVDSNGLTRYGKPKLLRNYNLPPEEYVVWSEHFRADNLSILLVATNLSRILALELRNMTELYVLNNPLEHGAPTCFCVDRRRHSLLVGTTHGIVDLWDLRFQLPIKTWGFSGGSPIHRIQLHPLASSRKHKFCIAGGTGQGELTVWDVEKLSCRELYRTAATKEGSMGFEPWLVDDERPSSLLTRFATSLDAGIGGANGHDRGIRAFYVGVQVADGVDAGNAAPEDGKHPSSSAAAAAAAGKNSTAAKAAAAGKNAEAGAPSPGAKTTAATSGSGGGDSRSVFFLTAGPDWKVRFWDAAKPDASLVVSGAEIDEPKPAFVISQPAADMLVVTERTAPLPASASATSRGGGGGGGSGGAPGSPQPARREGSRSVRSKALSRQQQELLKGHLDAITDVTLLELPYGMVLSADRSGVVYAFH